MAWREWVRTVEIEPSLYAADFANLGAQIDHLLEAGARVFHFDVGDGHFVPPVTIGPVVLRSIAPRIHERGGRIDCHLMVDDPAHHFEEIAASGGDSVTFHVEVADDVAGLLAQAREQGLGAGVAFNPGTEVEIAAAAANLGADLCLCMSIEPGYSGQEFMEDAYGRIERLRGLVDCLVQVDGGVKRENAKSVHAAGARSARRGQWHLRRRRPRRRLPRARPGRCMSLERALELAEEARGRALSETDSGSGPRQPGGEIVGEGATEAWRAGTERSSRSQPPASAPAVPPST